VLLDHNFGAKVLPADGTSGAAAPLLGPRMNGLGIHDAQVGTCWCIHQRGWQVGVHMRCSVYDLPCMESTSAMLSY
jgi:hypothetical protein